MPHLMVIQLIYRYHVIKALSEEHNDNTNVEGCKMIQRVIVGEFRVGTLKVYLIKNSQAVKKGAAPKKAMVKKDVKSKVAAKKWL